MKKLKNFQKRLRFPTIKLRFRYTLIITAIFILISFGVGYLIGVDMAIHEVAKLSKGFMNISIDENLIKQAIYQYNNQIGGCFTPLS